MPLTITAQIFDLEGKPLAQRDAQICIFTVDGSQKTLGVAHSDEEGKLSLFSKVSLVDYQPRVQLQLQRDGVYVKASESPASFAASACDFGRVNFNPAKLRIPAPVEPGDGVRPVASDFEAERIALTKELNEAFSQQLAAALAKRTTDLTAEKNAALTTQAQQQAAAQAQALATRTNELIAEKNAALTTQAQQLAAAQAQALATRTNELTAEKNAALTAQAQQLAAAQAAAVAAALANRTHDMITEKNAALAAQTQQQAAAQVQALATRTGELAAEKAAALAAQAQQYAQELATRDAALASKDVKIHDLETQLAAAAVDGPHETSVEDLAQSTASQISRVQQSLRNEQSGLRLGTVSLQLKVLPGKSGGRVSLPQASDIIKVGADALGSIDLAFIPEVAIPTPRTRPTAPRVLGYTEVLARRKLAERQLGVEVAFQLVTSPGEHGRVVLQRPPPGAPVTEGTVVLIAIGRQDEHDPRPT